MTSVQLSEATARGARLKPGTRDDTHEGTPVRVRFAWFRVTTPTPRWEQAFSTDGGSTWETNWVMDLSRAEAGT